MKVLWIAVGAVCLGLAAADVVLGVHGVIYALNPSANTLDRLFAAAAVVFVAPGAFWLSILGVLAIGAKAFDA